MLTPRIVASLFAAAIITMPALARDATPLPFESTSTALLSTATTVVGQPIVYPAGKPHVTAEIVTIAPGGRTIAHEHSVPMFFTILQGVLVVNYGAQGERTYRQGDAGMEAMNLVHFGMNNGAEPVRILMVYIGADGAADVIAEK
ncbi:MAG: cupin domain-containing protein [Xanthobacteraceae bacterium]